MGIVVKSCRSYQKYSIEIIVLALILLDSKYSKETLCKANSAN